MLIGRDIIRKCFYMLVSIFALGELRYVWFYKADHKDCFDGEDNLGAAKETCLEINQNLRGQQEGAKAT